MKFSVTYEIEALRAKKGITVGELAGRSGITEFEIKMIEKNRKMPSLYSLFLLADALEVDVMDLFGAKRV